MGESRGLKKDRIEKGVFFCCLFLLIIIRIVFSYGMPYEYLTDTPHDMSLQMQLGIYIVGTFWLGPYNHLTLTKGISYPVFLAVGHWLDIPYGIWFGVFIVISSVIFVLAVMPIIKKRWIGFCLLAVLLFQPVGFSASVAMTPYRNTVVPWAALMVSGSALGLYIRQERERKELLAWAVLEGLSLAFFWNLREDGLWLMPLLLMISLILIILQLLDRKKTVKRAFLFICITLLPFLILFLVQTGIQLRNWKTYGTMTVNDRTSGAFSDMIDAIHHIDDGVTYTNEPGEAWVTWEMMELAMDNSETLESVHEELLYFWKAWAHREDDPYLPGDISHWAIRDAVSSAGYYASAAKAEAFYRSTAAELKEAFENGSLQSREGLYLSSQARALTVGDILEMVPTALKAVIRQSTYYNCQPKFQISSGDAAQILEWSGFLRQPVYMNEEQLNTLPVEGQEKAVLEAANQQVQKRNQRLVSVTELFYRIYAFLFWITAALSLIGWCASGWKIFRSRGAISSDLVTLWLVQTGFFLSAAVNMMCTCLFGYWLEDAGYLSRPYYYYTPSGYLFSMIARLAGIAALAVIIKNCKSAG